MIANSIRRLAQYDAIARRRAIPQSQPVGIDICQRNVIICLRDHKAVRVDPMKF